MTITSNNAILQRTIVSDGVMYVFRQVVIGSSFPTNPKQQVLYIVGSVMKYWNGTAWITLGGGSAVWGGITGTLSAQTDLQNALNTKVDKVTGKQLSTEDYTTAEKNKLTGVEAGAQVNVIETVKVNNVALTPTAKAVDIQLKTINGTAIEGTGNIEISGGGGFTKQTLTDAASISWNVANGNYAAVTIAGNRTISNPSNFSVGQELIVEITQDGVGGRLITWDSYFTFDGGIIPILSSAAGDVDRLRFFVRSATVISFENAKFDV